VNVPKLVELLSAIGLTEAELGLSGPFRDHMRIEPVEGDGRWQVYYVEPGRAPGKDRLIFDDEASACWYLFGEFAKQQIGFGVVAPRPGRRPYPPDGRWGDAGVFDQRLASLGIPAFDPTVRQPRHWHMEETGDHWQVTYLAEPSVTVNVPDERTAYHYILGRLVADELTTP
jgi:hypothetical protein